MKKICFLLGALNGVGGTGRAVSILANHLCDKYTVEIICYSQNLEKIGYYVDPKIKVSSLFNGQRVSMSKGFFKLLSFLIKYLLKNKVDILLPCGALQMPAGIIAAKIARKKVICCDHSNYTCVFDAKFERESRNFAALFSDVLVTLTEKDIENYNNNTKVKAKMIAIANLTDEKLLKNRDFTYNPDTKKIISVGRLTYAKNYELLVEIAAEFLKKHPDWKWDIYGEGEKRKMLEELIVEKKVANLTLKGNVSDIYDRYKEYSLFVMTSRYEGFPMVLLEAMANKLPCLAFDCQTGPSDIIFDGVNGLLAEPENKADILEKIEKLVSDRELLIEMSKNTLLSLEKFSNDKILELWYSVLK